METQTTTQTLLQFIIEHKSNNDPIWGEVSTKPQEIIYKLSPLVIFNEVVFHNIKELSIPGILEYLSESLPNMDYADIQSIHCFEIFEEEEFPTLMVQIKTYFPDYFSIRDIETQISQLRSDNNEDIKYYNYEDIRVNYLNENSLDRRYVTRTAYLITVISRS